MWQWDECHGGGRGGEGLWKVEGVGECRGDGGTLKAKDISMVLGDEG